MRIALGCTNHLKHDQRSMNQYLYEPLFISGVANDTVVDQGLAEHVGVHGA